MKQWRQRDTRDKLKSWIGVPDRLVISLQLTSPDKKPRQPPRGVAGFLKPAAALNAWWGATTRVAALAVCPYGRAKAFDQTLGHVIAAGEVDDVSA